MSETDNPAIFSSVPEFMINMRLVSRHDSFWASLSLRTVFLILSRFLTASLGASSSIQAITINRLLLSVTILQHFCHISDLLVEFLAPPKRHANVSRTFVQSPLSDLQHCRLITFNEFHILLLLID